MAIMQSLERPDGPFISSMLQIGETRPVLVHLIGPLLFKLAACSSEISGALLYLFRSAAPLLGWLIFKI